MEEPIKMKAKTYEGLEDVLGRELMRLGADDVETENEPGTVTFTGDKFLLYQANYELRTALKIYKEVTVFDFTDKDNFFDIFREYRWSKILNIYKSFRIEVICESEAFGEQDDIKGTVTQIITDYFFAKSRKQPPHDTPNPAVVIVLEIKGNNCQFLLDASGASLAHRGYKIAGSGIGYDEVYSAGLVQLSGWKSNTNFIDPNCGIGTLVIEAAMYAYNIPPQICRETFGFFSWRDFDEELWKDVKESGRLGIKHNGDFVHKIIGYVADDTVCRAANQNVKKAVLDKYIDIVKIPADEIIAPESKSTVLVVAPKIDTFNSEASKETIAGISNIAKRIFKDKANVWIHSSYEDMPKAIGIQPSKVVELKYGAEENKFAFY